MLVLANLQKTFQSHLLEGDEEIVKQLTLPKKGTVHARLAIYANAYYWRLTEGLQQEYNLLAKLLGEEAFVEMAESFISTYPSRFFSLSEYNTYLAQFLSQSFPYSKDPHLSEIAKLIKVLSLSSESKDAPVLKREVLANLSAQNWPSLCFKIHPSVSFLFFQWNSFFIWRALAEDQPLPQAKAEPTHCAVWRKGFQPYAISLSEEEAFVAIELSRGTCFSEVCEAVYNKGFMKESEIAPFVVSILEQFLSNHWFSEIYFS